MSYDFGRVNYQEPPISLKFPFALSFVSFLLHTHSNSLTQIERMMMQENVLSSRRSPPSPEAETGGDEESKKRKHPSLWSKLSHNLITTNIPTANSNGGTRVGLLGQYAAILAFFIFLVVVVSRSSGLVCISSGYGGVSRIGGLYGSSDGEEGVGFDFGSLGVPWCRSKQGKTVEWTSKDLLRGLEEFVPIYETRPIKNNMFGMGFDHSFGLWFMARWLKPELMIESGAFKGHSTWVLRQAMPMAHIISLSPRHPEKYLKKGPAYVDSNCTYFAGKNFVDFGSMNWKSVMKKHGISDLKKVLIFFDDHQNELKRLKQALKAGFQNLIFEDNYDTGSGDHYSLRQICDQSYIKGGGHSCFKDSDEARIRAERKKFWEKAVDIEELCGKGEAWWGVRGYMRDDFNHSNKVISHAEHFQNSRYVESVLDVYWELPPVAGPSLTHQTRYDPSRASAPIVEDGRFGLFQRLGLSRLETSVFNGYTQMVFVQISTPTA